MSYAVSGLGQAGTVSDLDAWRRELGLAREAGIPVPVLKAVKGVESGGNPAALRFEPHLFWRRRKGLPSGVSGSQIRAAMTAADMAAVPYTPCTSSWRTANGLPACRHDRAASEVGSETNRAAFNRAFAIDADNAVRSTSWGSGQVLGGFLLDAYGGNPSRAVDGFFANPTEAGERMIVAWWRNARSDAVAAANASPPNFAMIAHRYNGCALPCETYSRRLSQEYAEAAPAWERVRAAVEAAGALVTGTMRSPMVPIVGGVALLAGAGFLGWALWRRRSIKSNGRRRRA